MSMQSKYIWMNGELVEFEKATIHFLTPALHYGVGVFEGIRCYATEGGPAIFRLREHLTRMVNSVKILGFRNFPYSVADLAEAVRLTVSVNGYEECYIRPLVYLTEGGWNLTVDAGKPAVGIASPSGSGRTTWARRPWRKASAPISPPSPATTPT